MSSVMSPVVNVAMSAIDVTIRPCASHRDLQTCVELQRRVWNFSDADIVPAALFVVAQHTGGHAYCACDGGRAIGFALAFAAWRGGSRYWHSHMVGVLPEYQNHGVGRLLKLYQRDEALRSGIDAIEWTFDPLESRNAYFNIMRLGAIARHYLPDCYGATTSPLHGSLPTDRLLIEWPLRARRVESAISGRSGGSYSFENAQHIAVPSAVGEWKTGDPERARQVQSGLRRKFTDLFSRGYAVTGFRRGDENCEYVLEPYED